MPASVSRRVTIAFLVSGFLAVIAGALGISLAVRSSDASRTALKTLLPAAASSNQLLADVVDQETGERGFVITDDRLFLQPYDLGQIEAPGLIATLERELVAHKIALALLAQVDVRYEAWLHTFAIPQIREVTSGNTAAAVATEKTGEGRELFDSLRQSMSGLSLRIGVEQQALTTHALLPARRHAVVNRRHDSACIIGFLLWVAPHAAVGYPPDPASRERSQHGRLG